MQALNEVSDLQENCRFLAMKRAHLATLVTRWQRFGCGHPPDSGQHSREALQTIMELNPQCVQAVPAWHIVTRVLQKVVGD